MRAACLPTLTGTISWHGYAPGDELVDDGHLTIKIPMGVDIYKAGYYLTFNQATSIPSTAKIHATLSDEVCGTGDPPFDGAPDSGTLESGYDWIDPFDSGKPNKTLWFQTLGPWTTTAVPNCTGASVTETWGPGGTSDNYVCPKTDGHLGSLTGTLTTSGHLASGITDTWDLDCTYDSAGTDVQVFKTSGSFHIHEGACPRIRTGPGYTELKDSMKERLTAYYDALDEANACYQFTSGYRGQEEQDKLYKDWHAIADKQGPDDDRTAAEINSDLHENGFGNKFEGWRKNGTAKGGPAKVSRHTSAEAADVSVGARPMGLAPFRGKTGTKLRAAFVPWVHRIAASAGLCGPPPVDPVHVEMPYKKGKQTKATCQYG